MVDERGDERGVRGSGVARKDGGERKGGGRAGPLTSLWTETCLDSLLVLKSILSNFSAVSSMLIYLKHVTLRNNLFDVLIC